MSWFCTARRLSRFDGRRFVSYSAEDGLPVSTLNHLLENTDGSFWFAINGAGLVRYDPGAARHARARFTRFAIAADRAANRANLLYRDRAGRLWIGTDGALFQLERERTRPSFRRISLNVPSHPDHMLQVWSAVEDPSGGLWLGTSVGKSSFARSLIEVGAGTFSAERSRG